MAEVTAMRNNALPYPVYGVAFTVVAPLLDADGDPISPSSPDSEVSKNGDTFADCTNEATEIATSSGVVYLTLTATEMTADIVTVRIQSTGAKTTIITLYPRKLPVLSSGTCQGSNDTGDIQLASGDSAVDDYYNGCLIVAVIDSTTEARIINDYVGSTKVAEISPAWNTAQPDSNDTYTIYLPEGRQVQPVNVTYWRGTAVPSEHTAGYPIVTIKDGTGTGEINTNAGAIALVDLVTTLTTYTGNTVQTGDSYAIVNSGTHGNAALKTLIDAVDNFVDTEVAAIITTLGTPSNLGGGATIAFNLSDIESQTDDIGTAGAGLTAVPWNAAWDAEVQSEVDDALVVHRLDELLNADSDIDGLAPPTVGSVFHELMSKTVGSFTFDQTTDSNEAIRDNMGTAQTGDSYAIVNSGTFGNSALKTLIDTLDNFVDTEVADLTSELAKVPKSDSTVTWNATALASIQTEANDAIVANRLDELLAADSDIDGAQPPTVGSVFHELMSKTAGSFTFDQATDSNEAIRDNMGTAQTGDSYAIVNSGTYGNAALKTLIDAIDDFVDTEVASILAAVDTEVAAIVSAIGTPMNLGGGATLAFNLSDIESQTDDIGAAGAGLTAVPWNASWDAEVQSEVDDALKAALTEGYRGTGATGSVRDLLYEIIAHLGESSITSTTKTLKKLDGSTTAKTYTLNSATTPTSITETT